MSGARTPATVLAELLAIGPRGDGMPTTPDTNYAQMLLALANELSLVETQMLSFETEIDPLSAVNLLADYERVLGPDPYGRDTTALTIGERQQLAYTRWVEKFGVRPQDFIDLAASLGVTITILEYELTTAGAFAGVELVDHPTEFAWLVTLPASAVTSAEAGSASAGDLVSSFPPSLVQPVIAARAPAHTNPYFSYTG
ncbi:MAG: putative phage tail protein [Acidiphilium sp.]